MPVPYNLDIVLYVLAKQSDDALQIVEQILPFFQPDYTITVNDMADMGIKRDVPIILNSISYEDNYEGDFDQRRALIYTMNFTCKFYLYGPVTSSNIIRTVQADQFADLPDKSRRENRDLQLHLTQLVLMLMMILDLMKQHHSLRMLKTFNPVTGEDE